MDIFHEALKSHKKKHGSEHTTVTRTLHSMGLYLCEQGIYDEAITYFFEELNILQKKFKTFTVDGQQQHMIDKKSADDLCGALLNVGNIYRKKKSLHFAIECYAEALSTYTSLGYTEDHHCIKVARRIVGRMQRQLRIQSAQNN